VVRRGWARFSLTRFVHRCRSLDFLHPLISVSTYAVYADMKPVAPTFPFSGTGASRDRDDWPVAARMSGWLAVHSRAARRHPLHRHWPRVPPRRCWLQFVMMSYSLSLPRIAILSCKCLFRVPDLRCPVPTQFRHRHWPRETSTSFQALSRRARRTALAFRVPVPPCSAVRDYFAIEPAACGALGV